MSSALLLSSTNLTFGPTPCGTTAQPKTINVTNTSTKILTMTLSLGINDGGSPYTVTGPAQIFPQDAAHGQHQHRDSGRAVRAAASLAGVEGELTVTARR